MKNKHIFMLILCALTAALTAVISQISIPTPFGIPLTLQTFAIALCAYLLGSKYGFIGTSIFIAMGALGLPVFTGFQGGISHIISSPTGGFIIGFLPLSIVCGITKYIKSEKHRKKSALLLGCLGTIICHICGVVFYSSYTNIPFFSSFVIVSLPFILKDILLCVLAYPISVKILYALSKNGYKF